MAKRNNGGMVFVFLHLLDCYYSLALNKPLKIALEGTGSVELAGQKLKCLKTSFWGIRERSCKTYAKMFGMWKSV